MGTSDAAGATRKGQMSEKMKGLLQYGKKMNNDAISESAKSMEKSNSITAPESDNKASDDHIAVRVHD